MHARWLPAPLLCALLLGACYYESPVPLAEPDPALMDLALLGTWLHVDPGTDDTVRMRVLPFSERDLLVELESVDSMPTLAQPVPASEPERGLLRAFPSELDGVRFMNVQEIEEEDRHYMLVRYEVRGGDTLHLRPLKDDIAEPPLRSSEELRAFLRANLENAALYDTVVTFVRAR